MARAFKTGLCVAIAAASLCFIPSTLLAAGKPTGASVESPYYSGAKLRELVDHYMVLNSPTYDKLQDRHKVVYAIHAAEFQGFAIGMLYSATGKDPSACLSWQSRNEYVAKFAMAVRDTLAYQHENDQPGPFIIFAASDIACDQSAWKKKQ